MVLRGFRLLAGIGLIVTLAAVYMRPVWPDTASNHGLKTATGLGYKLVMFVSSVGELFGFSAVNITRSISDLINVFDRSSNFVERYRTSMDGVEVILFKPRKQSDSLRPGIVFYHGGGWMFLSPELYAQYCDAIVEETGSVLVSVRYRLAPDHLYPVPLDDCLTATRHFLMNAKKYGVDENKIGVKGDSAGGNLAMSVALKLSKEGGLPNLKFMSLDYPALQGFDFKLPSYQKYGNGPGVLTKEAMVTYWLMYMFGNLQYYDMFYENKHQTKELKESVYGRYLKRELLPERIRNSTDGARNGQENTKNNNEQVPEEVSNLITDLFLAPLMASDEDLSNLPPTYMFNVEFDVLRDEGLIAAQRLERAGVKVTRTFLSTEEHSFINLFAVDTSVRQEVVRFAAFFNETLKI